MKNKIFGDRYKIIDKLGEGGMATVYIALDMRLNRKVAIKILHQHLTNNFEIKQRFYLEAKIISTLEHPNILKIYDFSGEHSKDLWIVMELLNGENLNKFARKFNAATVHPIIATCIICEILKALQEAHSLNLVHRDIKPENVMILKDGRIKLMDFGIAKTVSTTSLTMTGTFMGSPSYMSPEQIRGAEVDERSDIYSLGVVFYELITGRLPYKGNSTHDVILKICEGKYHPPKKYIPNIPDDLNDIIMKAMNLYPNKRYQKAYTFASDLNIFLALNGFEESHIELERYFTNREHFEQRLKMLNFTTDNNLEPSYRYYTEQDAKILNNPPQPKKDNTQLKTQTKDKKSPIQINIINNSSKQSHINPDTQPIKQKINNSSHHIHTPSIETHITAPKKLKNNYNLFKNNAFIRTIPIYQPPKKISFKKISKSLHLFKNPTLYNKKNISYYILSFIIFGIIITILSIIFINITTHIKSNQQSQPDKTQTVKNIVKKTELPVNKIIEKLDMTPKEPNMTKQKNQSKPSSLSPKTSNTKSSSNNKIDTKKKTYPKNNTTKPQIPTKNNTYSTKSTLKPKTKNISKFQMFNRSTTDISNTNTYLHTATQPTKSKTTQTVKNISQPDNININNQKQYKETNINTNKTNIHKKLTSNSALSFAEIIIQSQPAAEIYINGKKIGTTIDYTTSSGMIRLKHGKYVLELKRPGYEPYLLMLNLNPGEIKHIKNIKLKVKKNI